MDRRPAQMSRAFKTSEAGAGGEQDPPEGGSPATVEGREIPGSVANQGVDAQYIFSTSDHVCVKMEVAMVLTTTG
jgi:hypothetical protein